MLTGTLIIEGFGYSVLDAEYPGLDTQTGQPTGEVLKRKVIQLIPLNPEGAPMGTMVELRMTQEDYDAWVQTLVGKRIELATAQDLAQLSRGNGHA